MRLKEPFCAFFCVSCPCSLVVQQGSWVTFVSKDRLPLFLFQPSLWPTASFAILPDMPADFRDVDPRELRVPPSRRQGAEPAKLARQISLFGRSAVGMPPPWVYEGTDGVLVLYNGVTRATRIAKLAPGTLVRVEVIGNLPKAFAADPKIGDLLP